jgi:hypothetical protein
VTEPDPSAIDAQVQTLYGDVLTSRSCGGCVQCCVMPNIDVPELRKPAGVRCPNLVEGGCGIYESRPHVCRQWYCVWRTQLELPDLARPDRCGVMFSWEKMEGFPGLRIVVAWAVHSLEDFKHPAVRAALARMVAAEAAPVFLRFGDYLERIFPDKPLTDAIFNPHTTPHTHLLGKADQLRRNWGLTASPPP